LFDAHPGQGVTAGQLPQKMVRIGLMTSPKSLLMDRRELMAGLGAAALAPIWPESGSAQGRSALTLQPKPDILALRPGAETPIWSIGSSELRFRRGDTVDLTLANELPRPAVLNWRGLDGIPGAEPLTARAPVASGAGETLQLPLRHAGTFLCDLGLLGDGQARPSRP